MLFILIDNLHWKIFIHEIWLFSFNKYTGGWQICIGFLSILHFKTF